MRACAQRINRVSTRGYIRYALTPVRLKYANLSARRAIYTASTHSPQILSRSRRASSQMIPEYKPEICRGFGCFGGRIRRRRRKGGARTVRSVRVCFKRCRTGKGGRTMMKPIFLSLFFLIFFAVSPARAALFCGMRRNVACLIEAINEGRSSRVVKNLQAGADPNGEEDGRTPILPPKNAPAVAPRAYPVNTLMK